MTQNPTLLALLLLVGLPGCTSGITLTDAGTLVRQVSAADRPAECHLVGDVVVGIPPDAAMPRTEEDLMTLMRNKAGQDGANTVVVELSQQRTGQAGEIYYVGRGTSYRCPESTEAASQGATSGGAEPAEGEGGTGEEETETPPAQEDDDLGLSGI